MNAGLWIDCHRAVLVSHTEQNVDITLLNSNLDRDRWQFDVWRVPNGVRQRMLDDHTSRYYKNVANCVLRSNFIIIFGPGNAKCELREQLDLDNYRGEIIAVEPAGKMTDTQIAAKVRLAFCKPKYQETTDMTLEEGIASWCSPTYAVTPPVNCSLIEPKPEWFSG